MTDKTLTDTLRRQAGDRPDALAIKTAGRAFTFADLDHASNRIANALAVLGVGKGDRVACITRHHVDCLLLVQAACKLGAVCIVVNWRLAAAELEHIVHDGQVRFLLVDEFILPSLAQMDLPYVKQWTCAEGAVDGVPGFAGWYMGHSDAFIGVPSGEEEPALQLYSSGTTGRPKGVVLSHKGLISACNVLAEPFGFDQADVMGNPLPVFHIAGMLMMLLPLCRGGTIISYPEFEPAEFISDIERDGITHSFLVPTMLLFMLQQPAVADAEYSSLRLVAYGGSPISKHVLIEAMRVFRCKFTQLYGLTEVSGPASQLAPEDHVEGVKHNEQLLRSAGRAVCGTRIRIVDPVSLENLPDGRTGEIWLQSERNMIEYWNQPDATAEVFPEGRDDQGGWFRTGDAGYLETCYLYIQDRIKDMIISGGENIYPAEVENVLMSHPGVEDCAVIGVPDEAWGEAVKACVVPNQAVKPAEQEIIEFLRERIAHYKCPRSVDFMTELPRNPSGKILKRTLRKPYWEAKGA